MRAKLRLRLSGTAGHIGACDANGFSFGFIRSGLRARFWSRPASRRKRRWQWWWRMAMVEEAAAVCPNSSAAAAAADSRHQHSNSESGISVERSAPPFTGKFTGKQDSRRDAKLPSRPSSHAIRRSDADIPQSKAFVCYTAGINAEAILAAAGPTAAAYSPPG